MRSLVLALSILALAGAAEAQPARPSPTLFKSGACNDDVCARDRWLAFLKQHGETELAPAPLTQIRVTTFNAENCKGKADTVDLLRYQFKAGETASKRERSACGTRSSQPLAADRLASLAKLTADPDLAKLSGAFPAYCGEFEGSDGYELHLLEILQDGRYQLIEWDCTIPGPLKPLAAWLDQDRSRLP